MKVEKRADGTIVVNEGFGPETYRYDSAQEKFLRVPNADAPESIAAIPDPASGILFDKVTAMRKVALSPVPVLAVRISDVPAGWTPGPITSGATAGAFMSMFLPFGLLVGAAAGATIGWIWSLQQD